MAEEYCFTLSPRIKLYNVIMLGITFMFIFTGYGTVATIEETVLKSYAKEHEKFTGDGYTSLAIIYSVVALANWLAPPIISLIGSKYALFSAGCIYTLYNAMFIQPNVIGLYTVSVLMGFASAVIWTAMGTFLAMNSDDKTMGRNAAIFVTLSQISSVAGSLYVYIAWEGVSSITDIDRIPMIIAFTVVTGFGALLMLLFRSPPKTSTVEETSQSNDENTPLLSEEKDQECATVVPNRSKPSVLTAAWLEFIAAFKLCKSRDMLELSILGAYSGLEISFCAIYATTVGDMLAFGEDSDRLVGLTSTVMGVGEIVGGIALGILDKYAPVEGSAIGVLGVMILHGISYFLIFINTPDNAVWEPTMDIAYIPPNEAMAIVSSLFLGIGDAMVNILIFGLLGLRYSGDSAPAYALFNFVQTIAGAATLYYGTKLGLKWQLLILVTFLIPGTLLYLDVHRRYAKNKQQQEIEKREINSK